MHVVFAQWLLLLAFAPQAHAAAIVVDLPEPDKNAPLISPYIYGLGTYMGEDHRDDNTWSLKPTYFRFGGNMAEVFNWQQDTWNAGSDWFFTNFRAPRRNIIDEFMQANAAHGVPSAITLPIMGWIAKDGTSGSFPETVFGHQRDARNGFGNGLGPDGRKKLTADPNRAFLKVGPDWVVGWVKHLKTRFGNGPHNYILGNEPMLWQETHRDAHPEPTSYDELLDKYIATAVAVRKEDPAAVLIGPALWGWLAMQQSAYDERGPWNNYHKYADRERHGDRPFLEWFLSNVVKEEHKRGVSLIDVVDVHYYPDGEKVRNRDPSSAESRNARLVATRSLWDKSYKDDSWIADNIYMIPRLKELANRAKPGLKVGLGEYNFRAEEDISGGIVQAEVLGIFAREGLYSANYWTVPPANSPPSCAFKLFRNYDGKGSGFGKVMLKDSVGIQADHSVFAAWDPDTKTYTVLLVNKSLWDAKQFTLQSKSFGSSLKSARFFRYSLGNPKGLVEVPMNLQKPLTVAMPSLSLAMVELKAK